MNNPICQNCAMKPAEITREEMWARQQIRAVDVNYDEWAAKRKSIKEMSLINLSCTFTVDVYKGRYDFASGCFADIFGFNPLLLKNIRTEGDWLEEKIHPDDRAQLIDLQIKHSHFIYSLPFENRNDYSQIYRFRMLGRKKQYINVTSRQQVIQKDKSGKAWIIMGIMDISPDQHLTEQIRCSTLNLKTGDIFDPLEQATNSILLTTRETEILNLIRQGLLSKEIAGRLNLSIHTVNNHRKNILSKLRVDNIIEAINKVNYPDIHTL